MAHGNRGRGRAARSRGNRTSSAKRGSSFGRSFARPLWLEQLEDRRMLATFLVTNLGDIQLNDDDEWETVPGSLRAGVEGANETEEGDLIIFGPNLTGTISLQAIADDFGQLTIEDSMQIVGMGPRTVTVQAAGGRRIFEIAGEGEDPISVNISGLTLNGGEARGGEEDEGRGGAILNAGNLTLTEVVISNSEANEGGGIFNSGRLIIQRSLIQGNDADTNGGGIHNGVPSDSTGGGTTEGPPPFTRIVNSTITGNTANIFTGYGGGLFNRDGTMEVLQCTVVANSAYLGSGIGSYGNALPEDTGGGGGGGEGEDPPGDPPPTIFTQIAGTVLYANINFVDGEPLEGPDEIDIDVVGKGEAAEGEDPPDLLPSINIRYNTADEAIVAGMAGGNNLIFGLGKQVVPSTGDVAAGTDPLFYIDMNGNPVLANWGGSTNTFQPYYDETGTLPNSPLVDHHDTLEGLRINGADAALGPYDQRGQHFARVHEVGVDDPTLFDIGAVEVQQAALVVNIIADEAHDSKYSGDSGVESVGDFSVREALLFSELNPLTDTVTFDILSEIDPTPSSAPTLLLDPSLGELDVNHSVNIIGPESFIMEIDGNDPSPVFANGIRLFNVTDGAMGTAVNVLIKNLTLIAGDAFGSGGAIFNRENLTLENMSLRGNRASLDGGAIHHDLGTLTVLGSTISGNNSSDDGAIYIAQDSGAVTITNATISGNTSGDRGAGVFNRGTDTVIEHSTITNNNAGSTIGSGVMNFGAHTTTRTPANLTVYSTIISANFLNDFAVQSSNFTNPTQQVAPISTSLGYNLIGTVNAAAGGVFSPGNNDLPFSTTPGLAPLGFGGGLTQTHALLEGSLAIDASDPGYAGPLTNDQRGEPFLRVAAGVDTPGAPLILDIGAYELQGLTFIVDNPGDGDNGNYSVGDLTLREAITLANGSPRKDFIQFDNSLLGFTLSPGSLTISDDVDIMGLGTEGTTLSGGDTVFTITNGNASTLIDVTIGDIAFSGRNVVNLEDLTLNNVDFRGNLTSAITHRLGTLNINYSTLTGNNSSVSGGAINAVDAAGVNIFDSTITGNSTSFTGGHGGAIYLKNTDFDGEAVVLANNLTAAGASDGAGMFVEDSDVEFRQSVISGNATTGANSDGAAIFAKNSTVYIHDYTTLALNGTFGTSSKGGAIYLNGGGTLTITDNVIFTFNRTFGQFSHGGAIASVGGTVNILDTDVSNNSTNGNDAHGGAIYVQDGSLSVVNSALFDNSTSGLRSDGGAIFSNTNLNGQTTTIMNSTISGNATKDRGGGLYNADGLTVIKHSTITDNSAPYYGFGAGVGSFGTSSTTRTEVGSSIIAGNVIHASFDEIIGNTPSDVDRVNGLFQDTFVSLGYNLIGTGITGAFTGATNDLFDVLDPGLEELANNGGPSRTHALEEDSQAINRGNPAAVAGVNGVPEFDQTGDARIKQGRIDIGAFESDFSGALAGDFNGDGVINGRDFLAWQRGDSPNNGSSGDLTEWEDNFGTSGVSALSSDFDGDGSVDGQDFLVWQQGDSPNPLSADDLADWQEGYSTGGGLAATVVIAEETSERQSDAVVLGWMIAAPTPSSEPNVAEEERPVVDAAYLAAFDADLTGSDLTSSDLDFGDIATSRSVESGEGSEDLTAEDAVFELLGAGAL